MLETKQKHILLGKSWRIDTFANFSKKTQMIHDNWGGKKVSTFATFNQILMKQLENRWQLGH